MPPDGSTPASEASHAPATVQMRAGSRLSRRWLIPLAAVPVIAVLAYGFWSDPRAIPSPLVGRPAAPFTLTAYDGKPMTLEAVRGQVVLLNFWASWCFPACYEEAPVLEAAWQKYRDQGLVVLGVDMQDTEAAAARFIQQFDLTFRNAPDPKGKVSIDYGVYGVPETFLIDRRGIIREKKVGAVTEEALRDTIERLLKETVS